MSSKFFTNQNNNTLSNRLKDILSSYRVDYLEFLIGYFRLSGFSHIASYLKNVTHARILVGIDVDEKTLQATLRGKEVNLFNTQEDRDIFIKEQTQILNNSTYRKEVDESVEILVEMLQSKRVELKISQDKNIHSKLYIMREEPIIKHDKTIDYRGSVITGSSNLSENGLSRNFEFNVELRDSDDIAFALEEFNTLWSRAVEIDFKDIAQVQKQSYLRTISPYELYIKFLIEHFGEDRINFDESVSDDLPKGFKRLAYQIDAVNEGLAKLKKHNGFFLSDVVGLGKTVTTAMIVKRLLRIEEGEILIITPPSIKKEWEETFDRFHIGSHRKFHIYSLGELEKIKDTSRFSVVIVDESHKFKNQTTSRYGELERICKEQLKGKKKIILISATPLNNTPADLANQLYLFEDRRSSTIDSFGNLEDFFNPIIKEYHEIISFGNKELSFEDKEKLKKLSMSIKDNILKEVMVRRTRTDIITIDRYKKDLQEQKIKIPKINEVREIEYELDDKLAEVFSETVTILTDKAQGLGYHRYRALANLTSDAQDLFGRVQEGFFDMSSENLASLMKMMLIKRLESSFHAFKTTILKQQSNLAKFIEMFEKDEIYIAKNQFKLFEKLEDSDDEETLLAQFLEDGNIEKFAKNDFKDGYLENLRRDNELLLTILDLWDIPFIDPKLEKFKSILQNSKDKKVVFTESKDTALYLEKELNDSSVLVVHGANRDKLKSAIRENFDANFETQKDDFHTIISTDTLSEGVNMHRANIIYNYDIPWNSTRLMQRVGRINRIGTPHDEIFIYNFKPTAQSEDVIELTKKAFVKLQSFHNTLGEDSKIYTKDEKIGSMELFNENMQEERDMELVFLEEIRSFKEAKPQTYQEIRSMPNKMRVQREKKDYNAKSFVFIKNKNSKNYFEVEDEKCEAVNFVYMATHLKADESQNAILPMEDRHYEEVQKAKDFFEQSLNDRVFETLDDNIPITNKEDKKALKDLKSYRKKGFIAELDYECLTQSIKDGKYKNLSKEINKITKNGKNIDENIKKLSEKYQLSISNEVKILSREDLDIAIILSETFV